MTAPSDAEQLILEFVNRVRMDPAGEADRLIADFATGTAVQDSITAALQGFDVDLDLFVAQMASFDPVQPLAWSEALSRSATAHSELMIAEDEQSHQLPGEPGLIGRIEVAGYETPSLLAENIFAFTESALHGHAAFIIDWGNGPGGIQDPAGHRNALLDPEFTEIGVGYVRVRDESLDVGPHALTQHLGDRFGRDAALTGVITSDANENDFYTIGEGLAGVTVTATGPRGTFSTTSYASGGYALELPSGAYEVVFEGGQFEGTVTREITIGDDNLKLDIEALDAAGEDAIIGLRGNDGVPDEDATGMTAPVLMGTPGNDEVFALEGDDAIFASAGVDTIYGGPGDDCFVFDSDWAALTITRTGPGAASVLAPDGSASILDGVERIDLSDGNVVLDLESDNLGFAYRVYIAALGRLPGEGGLRFWTRELDNGQTQKQVAESFAASDEFEMRFGTDPSDQEFIVALYDNVLGRAPDDPGFEHWMGRLSSGSADQADMLVAFTESPENVAQTAPNLADGVFVLNGGDDLLA